MPPEVEDNKALLEVHSHMDDDSATVLAIVGLSILIYMLVYPSYAVFSQHRIPEIPNRLFMYTCYLLDLAYRGEQVSVGTANKIGSMAQAVV